MIEIDTRRCNACGLCEDVCPTGAITVNGKYVSVDESRCTECGSCVDACPRNAIGERVAEGAAATVSAGASSKGREAREMYRRGVIGCGRGRGFGYGMGYGRGLGFGGGFGKGSGRGMGRGFGKGWFGGGWGRGNPYCRFAPRRLWADPSAGYYEASYGSPYGYPDR